MGCDRPLTCILGGIGCSHAVGLSVIPKQNGLAPLPTPVTTAAEEADLAARGAGAGLSGKLRVSAAVTFARMHVVPKIPEF
jgi:hypothetical protein